MDFKKILFIPNFYWSSLPLNRKLFLDFLPIKIFIKKYDVINVKKDWVLIYSQSRKDYKKNIRLIYNQIPSSKEKVYVREQFGFNSLIIKDFLTLKNFANIRKTFPKNDIIKSIFLWLYFLQISQLRHSIVKWKVNYIVAHADMQPIENFIIQFLKQFQVTTITLQHGLYVDYSKNPNINVVNYKNVVSKYFLSWGVTTEKLIKKYNPDCYVFNCGNPSINDHSKKPYVSTLFFSVIFDQEIFKDYNQKLLKIAKIISEKKEMRFYVKLHPSNKRSDYELNFDHISNLDILYKSSFIIGHTSSLLFELMRSNIQIFKLDTNIQSIEIHNNYKFKNEIDLLNKLKQKSSFNLEQDSKIYFKYIDKISEMKYAETFNLIQSLNE